MKHTLYFISGCVWLVACGQGAPAPLAQPPSDVEMVDADLGSDNGDRDGGVSAHQTPDSGHQIAVDARVPDDAQVARVVERAMPPALRDAGTPLCVLQNRRWSAPRPLAEASGLRADVVHDVSSDGRTWVYSVMTAPAQLDPDAGPLPDSDANSADAGVDPIAVEAGLADGDASSEPSDAGAGEGGVTSGPQFEHFIVELPADPEVLTLPEEVDLMHGAALNSDADSLLVTLADQSGFAVVSRDSDGQWSTIDATGFGALQSTARHGGLYYRHPTLNKDGVDDTLHFSSRSGATLSWVTAQWTGAYWGVVETDQSLLAPLPEHEDHQVSSVSVDNRTAFVWDAIRQSATALELSLDPARPIQNAQNIESVAPVFVSADCSQLFTLDNESQFVVLQSEPIALDENGVPL